MIKFAKTDILDGINQLKIGIHNIIQSLIDKSIYKYKLELKFNYLILVGILEELFPNCDLTYYTNGDLLLNINHNKINITIKDDHILFQIL